MIGAWSIWVRRLEVTVVSWVRDQEVVCLRKCGFVVLLMLFFFCGSNVSGEEASDPLGFLSDLTGRVWLGHYSNPEDAHYNHVVRWSAALDGKAVRVEKKVSELNFEMETIFFWDPEIEKISFVSLTNRGQVSRGTAAKEDGTLVLLGASKAEGDSRDFKMSYCLMPDGTLEDRFFIKKGEEWQQRHLIRYNVTEDPAFMKLFD